MTYKTYTEDLADFGYREQEEAKNLFQLIYDSKAYTWLQGSYGRTLQDLINADLIQTKEVS